jgi:hypothetical protein
MIDEDPKCVLQRSPLNETNSRRLQKFAIAQLMLFVPMDVFY